MRLLHGSHIQQLTQVTWASSLSHSSSLALMQTSRTELQVGPADLLIGCIHNTYLLLYVVDHHHSDIIAYRNTSRTPFSVSQEIRSSRHYLMSLGHLYVINGNSNGFAVIMIVVSINDLRHRDNIGLMFYLFCYIISYII